MLTFSQLMPCSGGTVWEGGVLLAQYLRYLHTVLLHCKHSPGLVHIQLVGDAAAVLFPSITSREPDVWSWALELLVFPAL